MLAISKIYVVQKPLFTVIFRTTTKGIKMGSKLIDILQTYQTFKRIQCAGLNAQGWHGGISSVYNSQGAY